MSILLKAILVAIFTVAILEFEVLAWCFQLNQIACGSIVGLILGDWQTGAIVSATINLMYVGNVQVGGVTAYDFVFAGVLAPAVTILSNQSPQVGMSIALALGTLGLSMFNLSYSLKSAIVHLADKLSETGETEKVWIYNELMPLGVYTLCYGIPAFLTVYFGAEYLEGIMNSLPEFVMNGLTAVGTLLPCLGIAMMLKVVYNKKFVALAIIGYICAAYFGLTIIGTALMGAAFGLIYWNFSDQKGVN